MMPLNHKPTYSKKEYISKVHLFLLSKKLILVENLIYNVADDNIL